MVLRSPATIMKAVGVYVHVVGRTHMTTNDSYTFFLTKETETETKIQEHNRIKCSFMTQRKDDIIIMSEKEVWSLHKNHLINSMLKFKSNRRWDCLQFFNYVFPKHRRHNIENVK